MGSTSGGDRTGERGVESALGRDRTADGELPASLGSNRTGADVDALGRARLAPSGDRSGDESGVTAQAMRVAESVAGQAQDTTGRLVDQVKQQTTTRLAGQIGKASDTLGLVSGAVTSVSDQLREQDQAAIAGFVDQLGGQVQRVSTYLRDKDLDEIVDDTERFARRQPLVFLGGALTLGLLAARFLKSSGAAARPPVDRSTAARAATPFHLQSAMPGARPPYAYDMPESPPTSFGGAGTSFPPTPGATGLSAAPTVLPRAANGPLDYGQPT